MAVIYLRSSDGSDLDDGLTWATAKATLAAALTAAGAGGTIFASGTSHAESQASAMSLTSPGTAAAPVTILSVDDTGNPEPPTAVLAGASVTTTGGNSITYSGFAYVYGVTLTGCSGATTATAHSLVTGGSSGQWVFDTCELGTASTGASRFTFGGFGGNNRDQGIVLINTDIRLNAATQGVDVLSQLSWRGGALLGTAPTIAFRALSSTRSFGRLSGVDLSGVTGTLFTFNGNANLIDWLLENCKLGSGVTVTTGTINSQAAGSFRLVNCDSGDTNYRYEKHCYQGDITQETTIVRTGGASDGTTPVSREMVSSANSQFYSPLESDPIVFWNEMTGSNVTVTVEVVTDNVTLTDAEAWVEVEYLGTGGFPLSLFASDRAADFLATPANQASSTAAWTTTGLTTPVKQKLSVTFMPQEKGLVKARVMLAKASTTMYFDPKVAAG